MAEQTSSRSSGNLLVPVLILILVGLSFGIGVLWQKVDNLEKGGTQGIAANPQVGQAAPQQPPTDPLTPVAEAQLNLAEVDSGDHVRGNKNAKLTLIEYSDLECPFCRQIHPSFQKLMTEYDGKIKWIYRHFPLEQIHPSAQKAAEASECAAEAGGDAKFWDFVDTAFTETETTKLTVEALPDIAEKAGLNKETFEKCLDSGKFTKKVDDQQAGGSTAGVQGTPAGFILDGKGNTYKIEGALPYETIKQMVDKALQG